MGNKSSSQSGDGGDADSITFSVHVANLDNVESPLSVTVPKTATGADLRAAVAEAVGQDDVPAERLHLAFHGTRVDDERELRYSLEKDLVKNDPSIVATVRLQPQQ